MRLFAGIYVLREEENINEKKSLKFFIQELEFNLSAHATLLPAGS